MRSISVKRDLWLMTGILLSGSLGPAERQSAAAEPEAIRYEVQIERVSSGRRYRIGIANVGEKPYVDRQYVIRTLPKLLQGRILVLTLIQV